MSDNKTFVQKAEQKKLGLRDIFSDVLRRHTPKEHARLFLAGTPLTTPAEEAMLSQWLKPYLFARIFLAGILLLAAGICFGNSLFLPLIFTMGSYLVPIVVMCFFWEMNIPRNISFASVLLMFFIGGILSLVITLILSEFDTSGSLLVHYHAVGVIEETAKVAAAVIWLRKKECRYILTGMLVGASVGASFAAIESAGYGIILANWDFGNVVMRAFFAPGGHVAWAAITGGALAWAKGREPFSAKHLFHPVFLAAFGFSVFSHAWWDIFCSRGELLGSMAVWVLILAVLYGILRQGLNQVVEIAVRCNEERLTLALNHGFLEGAVLGERRDMGQGQGQAVFGSTAAFTAAAAGAGGCPVLAANYRLQGVQGSFAGRRFAIKDRIRIGRDAVKNDLVFPSGASGVSKIHCEIFFEKGRLGIRDLGSSYGTYVNQTRLNAGQACWLNPGDRVCLGSQREEFVILT